MARLVQKTAQKPVEVGEKWICMCGLSECQPFCDKSHLKTADETTEEVYIYTDDARHLVNEIVVEHACCGGKKEGVCCGKGNCSHK